MRAFSSDSFEDMRSDFTPDFLAAFAARRGYDLRRQLPALAGQGDPEVAARVLADYRETVSDLLLDAVRALGGLGPRPGVAARATRRTARPANLLDLYAAADIPETEAFGPSHFPIPGLRTEPNLPAHFGKPDTLFSKLASSAAHLAGRPLVSAESATWLGEHFQVAPVAGQARAGPAVPRGREPHLLARGDLLARGGALAGMAVLRLDRLRARERLLAGDARAVRLRGPHPGAAAGGRARPRPAGSTSRCTTCGRRRPVGDRASKRLRHLTAHDVGRWLHGHPTGLGRVAGDLLARGVMFDFVSDRLLARAAPRRGTIVLVPGARLMPLETWERLRALAEARGDRGVHWSVCPRTCPGWARWTAPRADCAPAWPRWAPGEWRGERRAPWRLGRGASPAGPGSRGGAARRAGVRRERIADSGSGRAAACASRRRPPVLPGQPGRPAFEGWAPLAGAGRRRAGDGCRSGQRGHEHDRGRCGRLGDLPAPGAGRVAAGADLQRARARGRPRWRVAAAHATRSCPSRVPGSSPFLRGGPTLPAPVRADGPTPWTRRPTPPCARSRAPPSTAPSSPCRLPGGALGARARRASTRWPRCA